MRRHAVFVGAAAIVAAASMACSKAPAEEASNRNRAGYVVDSVRPIEVDLARFRDTLGPAPAVLAGGAESLDALVRRFASAVSSGDTIALRQMQVSAAEYAWLIYPSSPHVKPPYQQAPEIAWMLMRQPSETGLRRLLDRRGGSPLRISRVACEPEPRIEEDNRYWRRCAVTTGVGAEERLFGAVVSRRGHFKFLSYQNQY